MKTKVKWNESYGIYSEKGVRKAYKGHEGNVADINLMLTSMLRFAGLNANPVLISTRNNGVPAFPTIDGFNYVISMVEFSDNTHVLLDATEVYSLPNILPLRDLNWNGRKVTKEGLSSWVALTSEKPALEENFMRVKITDDLVIEGVLRTKIDNVKAMNFRIQNNHLKEENIISSLESEYKIEIDNFKITNNDKINKPISRIMSFISEDSIEEINGKLYVNPLLFFATTTNPFKLEERKFPVDFGTPWKDVNNISIAIPNGYKVASLPAPLAIGLPENLGVFKFQVKQMGNSIAAISSLAFNKAMISPQYYEILKKFYGDLVEKQSEKITLVKE